MPEHLREETSYEHTDASALLILSLAAVVAVTVTVSIAILSRVYRPALNPPSVTPKEMPVKPRLLVNEPADLQQFEDRQKKRLESYGWVDRQHGIVRIPIEEAMKRAAAKGFPDWPGNPK